MKSLSTVSVNANFKIQPDSNPNYHAQSWQQEPPTSNPPNPGTFGKSQQVESVDYFLSHSWSAGRFSKYVALLYGFNLSTTLWCCAVVAYLSCLANLLIGDGLPKWMGLIAPNFPSIDGTPSPYYQCGEAFIPPTFVLVLFTAHWWRGKSAPKFFLDIW